MESECTIMLSSSLILSLPFILNIYLLFFPYFKSVTILSFCDVGWLCFVEELYGHVNESIYDPTKLMGA